jgi:hypothetical protein
MKPHTNTNLAHLAYVLSTWVDGDLSTYAIAWASYRAGTGELPGPGPSIGNPVRDSDYWVFTEAMACVRFGWAGKAEAHLNRVEFRMKYTPKITRFSIVPIPVIPQVRTGRDE